MRGRDKEKGTALVEFAIVLPILLLFLFSIIEFGLALYNKQVITNASREGARYGIINHNPYHSLDEIKEHTESYFANNITLNFGENKKPEVNTYKSSNFLNVKVTYEHDFFLPFLPDPLNMTSKTAMRYE